MWGLYGTEFLGLALVHLLAVILPGPDFAITVRNSVRYGYFIGCLTALGIGVGISVHVLYTLIGVGIIIQQSAWLMLLFRIGGALYLIYLGWNLLRVQSSSFHDVPENGSFPALTGKQAFMTGFMTNALNPKATIFFLAIFTTLVSSTTPIQVQALYGVWMCFINALWFICVTVMFSQPMVRNKFLKMGKNFERFMGIVLIGFAIKLVFTTI